MFYCRSFFDWIVTRHAVHWVKPWTNIELGSSLFKDPKWEIWTLNFGFLTLDFF